MGDSYDFFVLVCSHFRRRLRVSVTAMHSSSLWGESIVRAESFRHMKILVPAVRKV